MNSDNKNWNNNYNLLEEYIKQYNKLPTRLIIYENIKLGAWVGRQRDAYNKGKISEYRIQKLNQIEQSRILKIISIFLMSLIFPNRSKKN